MLRQLGGRAQEKVRARGGRRPASSTGGIAGQILHLQQTAGNTAVTTLLLQRKTGLGAQPLLRPGSTGDDVRDVQASLNRKDEVPQHLAVDGIFGPLTTRAVKQFQAAHPPLAVDAIVGPATRAALGASSLEAQDSKDIARKVFHRGVDAYNREQFGHAYDFFTRAHELYDRPGLIFSRAQALRRLGGRREQTIALYEEYIARGGERSAEAAVHAAELRGPAKTGDENVDKEAARSLFDKGVIHYNARRFAHAYDEFTKAHELYDRPGLIFSRAQALRRLGGRREEAIALYEEYIARGGERIKDAAFWRSELREQGAGP